MKPMVIPVIHYADDNQAMRNAERAFDSGCSGVMLIEMRGRDHLPVWVAGAIKRRWPDRLVGLNFLNADTVRAMPIYAASGVDMTWTDHQITHSLSMGDEARLAFEAVVLNPGHLFFFFLRRRVQVSRSGAGPWESGNDRASIWPHPDDQRPSNRQGGRPVEAGIHAGGYRTGRPAGSRERRDARERAPGLPSRNPYPRFHRNIIVIPRL
jgi:hypothetical protein